MPIDSPVSDLSRAIQHEPDQTWPTSVKVQLHWDVDGHTRIRTALIDADMFFGLGAYGAPLDGAALIGMIENMRRQGPPEIEPRQGKSRGKKKR